ncbi:MAG: M20 family metallo-hydrolase [Parafilimonas sp.]
MQVEKLYYDALQLLQQLISIPSFSKEEDKTADAIEIFLQSRNIETTRLLNNIWCKNKFFNESKPIIFLNSHHDTVKPNKQYTRDPFKADIEDGKLFGLGSNDAGGCLVALMATFIHYYHQQNLKYNLVFAATAEEEISGKNGIELLLNDNKFNAKTASTFLSPFRAGASCAIVGEPTLLKMAIAEKGLLVLDCKAHGKAGHAAREEGDNAIYKALKDFEWFKTFQFNKVSDLLGPNKMSVTIINAGSQHNVVPSECTFTVDIRVNELYDFDEVISIIKQNIQSEIAPRSLRLRSTNISLDHPLVKAGIDLNRTYYGSPTTSDKALMNFPALKLGAGDSARSHSADEFIFVDEIREGIELYIQLLDKVLK